MTPDNNKYLESIRKELEEDAEIPLESMSAFFTERIDGYEDHMLG